MPSFAGTRAGTASGAAAGAPVRIAISFQLAIYGTISMSGAVDDFGLRITTAHSNGFNMSFDDFYHYYTLYFEAHCNYDRDFAKSFMIIS